MLRFDPGSFVFNTRDWVAKEVTGVDPDFAAYGETVYTFKNDEVQLRTVILGFA